MIRGILFTFLFTMTIAQANGPLPYNSRTAFDYKTYSSVAYPSVALADRVAPVYQQNRAQNWNYYHPHPYGYYSNHPPQYPLFYYLPEIKEAKISVTKVPEFRDINDILDQKSEQAIRRNNLNHEMPAAMLEDMDNNIAYSSTDLSDITSSSLIFSARKKRQLATLIPDLLNNQRIFLQDREKLQQLLNEFINSKKITAADENWLQKMSEEYHIPNIQLNNVNPDDSFEAISHLNNLFP